jgi:hypothetical protein
MIGGATVHAAVQPLQRMRSAVKLECHGAHDVPPPGLSFPPKKAHAVYTPSLGAPGRLSLRLIHPNLKPASEPQAEAALPEFPLPQYQS